MEPLRERLEAGIIGEEILGECHIEAELIKSLQLVRETVWYDKLGTSASKDLERASGLLQSFEDGLLAILEPAGLRSQSLFRERHDREARKWSLIAQGGVNECDHTEDNGTSDELHRYWERLQQELHVLSDRHVRSFAKVVLPCKGGCEGGCEEKNVYARRDERVFLNL